MNWLFAVVLSAMFGLGYGFITKNWFFAVVFIATFEVIFGFISNLIRKIKKSPKLSYFLVWHFFQDQRMGNLKGDPL
jgi:hypothetical protein